MPCFCLKLNNSGYFLQKKSDVTEDSTTLETDIGDDKPSGCGVSEDIEMRNMLRSQNRKKKSGGFQSMGWYCACISQNVPC